ncbi:MAG: rhodanese-like domain-containing protein [Campylobacterales bacterium]|nr:rhodanese-like domain-containing protein [Campylobacterales bacterium]
MFRDKVDFSLLDIRTDAESLIVAVSSQNSVHIPLEKLFTKTNLDRLPTDKPVIIICHSGTRATMAAVGLKQLGFKNIQVLKGGIVGLAQEDTPKNAPMK